LSDDALMERKAPSSVVVGLSSGVDSSVAAWLLKEQGYAVVGVTLALAGPSDHEDATSCCSPTLMAKAKAIADHLRIPHYAVDKVDVFRRQVVDYFVSEYSAGRTPNPCSKCNARVRFYALADVASRLGASFVATGHYARLNGEPPRLSRGLDPGKDQSYVLAEVDAGLLERCILPLGSLTKVQVRKIAAEVGLARLVSEESQDLCFVPRNDYRAFLLAELGERPGTVVDEHGKVLGSHTGTYNYTVGQRKGLGSSSGGGPLYVTSVDVGRRRVVAGTHDRGAVQAIRYSPSAFHRNVPGGKISVQFRSTGKPVRGVLIGADKIVLDQPTDGIAPGQTIVVYAGDDVVMGGTISSTERDER
jgi:tRNA-specific 2-thiouridylase